MTGCRCGGRVVGVSLVESSMNGLAVCGSCLSTAWMPCGVCGCGTWCGSCVVGLLAHCWALRDQVSARCCWVGGWFVSWCLIFG